MDFINSTSSLIELSARVKRLAQHFNIIDPSGEAKRTALGTYRDKSKQSFLSAVSNMRARQDANKPLDPSIDKTIKDGSGVYDKGLQVGGTATTQSGLPVEPGTYRLKGGNLIIVGEGSIILAK